jgi:pyrroline-5-carboxylate reductase
MIGVTSSSPAYVFRFIDAIYQGALQQGVPDRELLSAICDVVIGSALLLKGSEDTPEELISKVASKGGTTEKALEKLTEYQFDNAIFSAMLACTQRAEELGQKK